MNKAIVVVGAVALIAGGAAVAHASMADDDHLPLPPPKNDECYTSQEVAAATSDLLKDSSITAQGYRNAAKYLEDTDDSEYCNEEAVKTAQASIQMLLAKATLLDGQSVPGQVNPGSPLPILTPNIFQTLQIPAPGFVTQKSGTGLHNEPGTVYIYPTGDMWFIPNDHSLAPYFVPGGSTDIHTQGTGKACCASCAMGGECEGCG